MSKKFLYYFFTLCLLVFSGCSLIEEQNFDDTYCKSIVPNIVEFDGCYTQDTLLEKCGKYDEYFNIEYKYENTYTIGSELITDKIIIDNDDGKNYGYQECYIGGKIVGENTNYVYCKEVFLLYNNRILDNDILIKDIEHKYRLSNVVIEIKEPKDFGMSKSLDEVGYSGDYQIISYECSEIN